MAVLSVKDYRVFLRDYAETKRLTQRGWNYSRWARALGLRSTSSLTKVLSGERAPGPKMVKRFVHYFRFSDEEEAHFRSLILLTKDRRATGLGSFFQSPGIKLVSLQKRVLELFEFRLIAEWHHFSIRELFRVKGLGLDSRKIRKLLLDDLPIEAIDKSIALLKALSLIQRSESGQYFSSDDQIQTQNEISDSAIRFYHEQKLEQAKKRLNDTPPSDRDFQALTLLLSHENLPVLKAKLRKFIEEIEKELAIPKVDQLYQLQFQLFPVSKRFEESHEIYFSSNENKEK
jgi:uncharacterized protein (TIGR02147 family)